MRKSVRAGVFFEQSQMRYAEVERASHGPRLLRLGSCDFDFDAETAILHGQQDRLTTIRDALSDVYSGTDSEDFCVVLPSSAGVAFFAPVPAGMDVAARSKLLANEAAIVAGSDAYELVSAERADGGDSGDGAADLWHYVAAIPQQLKDRLSELLSGFPAVRQHYLSASQAAVRIALSRTRATPRRLALVGCHAGHADIAITNDLTLVTGKTVITEAATDTCYYLAAMLVEEGLDSDRLDAVLLYGTSATDELVRMVRSRIHAGADRLNPLEVVVNDPSSVKASFDATRYVLCIGGAV